MLSEAESVADYMPSVCYLVALVPLVLAISSPGSVIAATSGPATNHFVVYRVHQLDMPHGTFGSRSSIFNLEAITPVHISDSFVRKCALFKWHDLIHQNYDIFSSKVLQETLVAGVLIIFDDLSKDLSGQDVRVLQSIEKKLLTNETSLPIYFIKENAEINRLYEEHSEMKDTSRNSSLYSVIASKVFVDSHQLVVSSPSTIPINNVVVSSLQAKLIGAGIEDQLPTYAITAHYDSYSAVPALSFGADSNASGLVLLLELMRVFSKLYSNIKTKPKANLIFFVSGGGKLNYFGTHRWLEEYFNSDSNSENFQFAMCLESVADSLRQNGLFMYVSKPPKAGTAAAIFWDNFKQISDSYFPLVNTSQIHKKINLADHFLSWEHERFSLRRVSAFTLSSLATSKVMKRRSLVDVYDERYVNAVETNANLIGEALARQLYGPIKENLLTTEFAISHTFIKSTFEHLANIPRAQQLLVTSSKGSNHKLPSLLKTIQHMMKKYSNNNVRVYHAKVDAKEPEFIFYDPVTSKMSIYNMKPAIFDLFITCAIILYLGVFYLIVKNFHYIAITLKLLNHDRDQSIKIKTK